MRKRHAPSTQAAAEQDHPAGADPASAELQAGRRSVSLVQQKEQTDLINTLGGELAKADDEARHILLSFFYKADANYGEGLTKVAKADLKRVKALAAELKD